MTNSPRIKFVRAPLGVDTQKRVFVAFLPEERAQCESQAKAQQISMSAHVRDVYLDGLKFRRENGTARPRRGAKGNVEAVYEA